LTTMYGATPGERARLTGDDARVDGYPLVINDGVFVADHQALLAVDAFLRTRPGVATWVHGNPRVWWRQKAALNLALAMHDSAVALDWTYNVQLHAQQTVPRGAKILHFNGAGRPLHPAARSQRKSR
jgi:hypothetical protein